MERRQQGRGWDGHFLGFWARLNCEEMPVIPAWLVRRNLDDPRKIPYLLVWKHGCDGKIMEAVRLARQRPFDCEELNRVDPHEYVELKRTNRSTTILQIVWRTLPRNGGRALLLVCSYCNTPRRHLYGWEWDSVAGWSNSVRQISWRCRSCARLRYSSEGGYLRSGNLRWCPELGVVILPRPASWLPYVFTSIDDPRLDEFVRQ